MSKQGGVHMWEGEVLKVRPEEFFGGWNWGEGRSKCEREGWEKRNRDVLFL